MSDQRGEKSGAAPPPALSPAEAPNVPRALRRLVLPLLAAGVLMAVGGWYAWRRYTAPAPPEIALEGAEPAVARAIADATDGVRRSPRSGGAWGTLGQVLRAHGYPEEAAVCFAHAQTFDRANPRWPYLRALELLGQRRAEAIALLECAAELCDRQDEDNTAPRLKLAEALLDSGRPADAARHFRRVLEADPQNPRALYGLGVIASSRNDLKAAAEHLTRCCESPFTRQKACARLAAVCERRGETRAAADFLRRARQLPKDLPWPDPYAQECEDLEATRESRYQEAKRLREQGRFAESAGILRAVAEKAPEGRAYLDLGISLCRAGEFARAEEALRQALHLEPRNVQAHYYLGLALFYQAEGQLRGRAEPDGEARRLFQEAMASARKATRFKADHALAHLLCGRALKRLGRSTAAILCFRQAVRCRPDYADLHLELGEALAAAGAAGEARIHLGRAAQLAGEGDPQRAKAQELLKRLEH
jgi:tetratricopeptide (TPR) repeat protein